MRDRCLCRSVTSLACTGLSPGCSALETLQAQRLALTFREKAQEPWLSRRVQGRLDDLWLENGEQATLAQEGSHLT